MSSKYPTIKQHEPLRVPAGWAAPERRLIAQLEEILDDLYSRFNRLKMSDLSKGLQAAIKSGTDGVAELRTELTQTEAEIAQKASKSEVDALTGRVDSAESAIELKADGIDLTSLREQVDSQEIGGRNVLLKTGEEHTTSGYNVANYWPSDLLEAGAEYTITVCCKPAAGVTMLEALSSGGWRLLARFIPDGTDKQIISTKCTMSYYPGRVPTDPTETNAAISFYRQPNNGTVTGDTTIYWVKMERGNMATDWTPAPEDAVETLENTSVRIDPTGVRMKGGIMDFQAGSEFKVRSGGTFNVFANDDDSVIRFGGTEQNPNFSLGAGGNVKAKKITAVEMELADGSLPTLLQGSLASRIMVSASQPSGHGILWFQPGSSSGAVDFILSASGGEDMTGASPSRTLTGFARQGSALSGSTCTYGVRFRIYNYSGACWLYRMTVKIQRSDGTGTVTIYDRNHQALGEQIRVGVGDYFELDTLNNPSAALTNITDASSLKLIVTLTKSDSTSARFEVNQPFTIRAVGSSSSSAQSCTVKYIP